jgi:hypothetical protein
LFSVGERNREAVVYATHLGRVDRLYPRNIILLEPDSVIREVGHGAGLKRLQSAGPVVVCEGEARIRRRKIGPEAERLQVALLAGLSDLRPELHGTAEDAMFNIEALEMGCQGKSVGARSNDRDRSVFHNPTLARAESLSGMLRGVERKNLGKALIPR